MVTDLITFLDSSKAHLAILWSWLAGGNIYVVFLALDHSLDNFTFLVFFLFSYKRFAEQVRIHHFFIEEVSGAEIRIHFWGCYVEFLV